MTTKKYKLKQAKKNITRKNKANIIPSLKILNKDFILYGAKNKDMGFKILDYTKANEEKKHKHCNCLKIKLAGFGF